MSYKMFFRKYFLLLLAALSMLVWVGGQLPFRQGMNNKEIQDLIEKLTVVTEGTEGRDGMKGKPIYVDYDSIRPLFSNEAWAEYQNFVMEYKGNPKSESWFKGVVTESSQKHTFIDDNSEKISSDIIFEKAYYDTRFISNIYYRIEIVLKRQNSTDFIITHWSITKNNTNSQ